MANIAVSPPSSFSSPHGVLTSTTTSAQTPANPAPLPQDGKQVENRHEQSTQQLPQAENESLTSNVETAGRLSPSRLKLLLPTHLLRSGHLPPSSKQPPSYRSRATLRRRAPSLHAHSVSMTTAGEKSVRSKAAVSTYVHTKEVVRATTSNRLVGSTFRGFLNLGLVLLVLSAVHGLLGEIVLPKFSDSNHVFATMLFEPVPFFFLGSCEEEEQPLLSP